MNSIIDIRSLDVGYGRTTVLENLTFSIGSEKITVILGPSGCGKSTLLKTLCGLIPPLAGEIHFGGQQLDFQSDRIMNRLFQRIGVLYQSSALLNSFDLYHNLSLPIRMNHPDIQPEIESEMVAARLEQVGLSGATDKHPSELSGGMRKRAALARAMILDPEVVFCDEPSAGLDPLTAAEIDRLLVDLNRMLGVTFVVVTHEVRSIRAIADQVIALQDGRMRANEPFGRGKVVRNRYIKRFLLEDTQNGD